ncbi:MAG: GatB/YqeY domain-containing protein [Ktedonobacteraceae bacterium]|nr:GatB/YqeY domain-containing protein [Ktedonobacteraceae bacterium]MBO0794965.1 GatB/YqeY domain-containing protein [Ktedonobacteraceae bacterium]
MPEARQPFPLEEQLRSDMKEAMKARDQVRVDTLRMAMSAVRNLEVARTDRKNEEYGQPMTEKDIVRVLEQEVKKRNQAIQAYKQGGRTDLEEKEQKELDILRAYLKGSQLSDEEVRAVVVRLVEEHGKEFRRVMPLAAKELKGQAEGARVQQIVRELTQ